MQNNAQPVAMMCRDIEEVYSVPGTRPTLSVTCHVIDVAPMKDTGGKRQRKVLALVCASQGMACSLALWSPTAEKYERVLMDAIEQDGFPVVEINMVERVTVCAVPKAVYKLQSIRQTSVKVMQNLPLVSEH